MIGYSNCKYVGHKKLMLVKDWPTSRMLIYAIIMLICTIMFLIS